METWAHFDTLTGDLTIEHKQDVQPILERNKRLQNWDDGYGPSREWRRAASIPVGVIYQWLGEGINVYDPNHEEAVRRKLNDPNYRFLRTAPGRL